jgi:hypothetical protein
MLADDVLMAHVDHLTFHAYNSSVGAADSLIRSSLHPDRNFWLSEWSQIWTDGYLDNGGVVRDEWVFASRMTDDLIQMLQGGAAAALAFDAYDNVHEHCNCVTVSHWGLLALNQATGLYSPKKRYFTNAQLFRFLRGGWVRIGTGDNNPFLHVVAFVDTASNQLTVVGHNLAASSVTVRGTLTGLPVMSGLHLYETSALVDVAQLPDVPVSLGTFSVDIPPETFFTLTTLVVGPTPTITSTPTRTSTPTGTPTPGATPTSTSTPLPTFTPGVTLTPTIVPAAQRLITFDGLLNPNRLLTGQYPSGVIDWGGGAWYLAGPYYRWTSNSISFSSAGPTSASFGFVSPRRLLQLDAYNGGTTSSVVSLSCAGQPTVSATLAPDQISTIVTGWSATCTNVNVGSTNGWYVNFDRLSIQ